MSLTGSCFSSESAPRPFHHGIRERGGTIFWAALPSDHGRSKRTCELTSSIVPRGTLFHHAVELECSPLRLDTVQLCHAATASRVQRNSVPSTQMRCMITASRRARATIAFFMPRCLAICIAQALSQDHLVEREQHALGRFVKHCPHQLVSALRYCSATVNLARLVLGGCQSKHRPD